MLSVLVALAFARSQLASRFSDVVITPPERLPLGGYTERHGKVMDPGGEPLHSRTIVFTYGNRRVAIVSVETLTVPESLVREVSSRIPSDVHILLCATHTHCAPDSQMLNDRMTFAIPGIATYKRRWLAWYADRIAGGINAALKSKPTPISRLVVETWLSDVNRGRRKGADPDKTATLVKARSRPLLFEYAAHGTFYDEHENRTRGDWPGKVGLLAPIALIGPIGDVSPKAPGLDRAPGATKIAGFWSKLISDRRRSLTRSVWAQGDRISWVTQAIPLASPKPHPTFEPRALGQRMVARFAPPTAYVEALLLGKLAIVGIPGEPTSQIGRRISHAGRALGLSDVLVVSHCDGWMGYILEPKDYDAGGYESSLSFYGREEGERVVQTALRALREACKSDE